MHERQHRTEPSENDLFCACVEVAQSILGRNSSPDVIETVAGRYYSVACEYKDQVRGQRERDEVIANAVRYLAHTQAIPPMGTDTGWFMYSLGTLLEVAVPNSTLDRGDEGVVLHQLYCPLIQGHGLEPRPPRQMESLSS